MVWGGGHNDLPFFVPTVHLCLVDPHRAERADVHGPLSDA